MASKLLSSEQAKERIRAKGITVAQWAEQRGFERQHVYNVLNNRAKGRFGYAHEIAIALGMKAKPSTDGFGANTQTAEAA